MLRRARPVRPLFKAREARIAGSITRIIHEKSNYHLGPCACREFREEAEHGLYFQLDEISYRNAPPFAHLAGISLSAYSEVVNARLMPRDVAERVWQMNLDDYKAYASQFERVDERIVNNPLTALISASVLHLGACHEEQLARDGPHNGCFTAALKTVWNHGACSGNYKEFIDQINRVMNRQTQTSRLNDYLLVRDQGFLAKVREAQPT